MSLAVVESLASKLHGISPGMMARSDADLAQLVRQKLPLSALRNLSDAGFSEAEIDAFIIPQRTRRHRAAKGQTLNQAESDNVIRLMRLVSHAEICFGAREKAWRWLRKPLAMLDGETPLGFAQSDPGARVIETMLAKIEWGAAA